MVRSKCKCSKTWQESKTHYHTRKKLRVPQNAFINVHGLCKVPLANKVEVEKQFSVSDSAFYKAESKVSKVTITAITDHVDGKAYHIIIELANGMDLLANSEGLFVLQPHHLFPSRFVVTYS